MTPPILNTNALELQPWGHGVSIAGAGRAGESLDYWEGE